MKKRSGILSKLFFLLLFSRTLFAWSDYDHQAMVAPALQQIVGKTGLGEPCAIQSLAPFLKKLTPFRPGISSPKGDSPAGFARFIDVNTKIPIGKLSTEESIGRSIKPIDILRLHAIDPDDGRDQRLRSHFYREQVWFGAGTGVSSQAFRHIEKPPFNPFRFDTTFGFPFWRLGQATDRVQLYFDLALLARSMGEEYWGWRFLAASFHYLQDLHQPFHATQISPEIASRGLRLYFQWGRAEHFSPIGTIAHLMSNLHHFFEEYVGELSRKGLFNEPLKGTDTDHFVTPFQYATVIRDRSNRLAAKTIHVTAALARPVLFTPYKFPEEHDEARNFLATDSVTFDKDREELMGIVRESFGNAGIAMRTLVFAYQREPKEQDSEKLLKRIERYR
ncbi:MAG: hypothetical protein Q7S98_05070 [Deltaproteobacteria bacterium]|nr:hypothetical protein [Deltaproteobacteria bacterium]